MPLPLTVRTAADAYADLRRHGSVVQTLGRQLRAQIDAGTVYPAFLLDVLAQARVALAEVPDIAETPGLGNYIRAQLAADEAFDLTAPLQQCLGALAALVGAIAAEYPKDADTGLMADRTMQPDGAVAWATIPATSMPQTSAALDAFLATLA